MEVNATDYTLDPAQPNAATRFGTNAAGRRVVLKRLETDCLLAGTIHPNIKERLQRVRELPVTHMADLLDVERIDGQVWLVWSWLDGRPLDCWDAETSPDEAARRRVLAEAALIVEQLHAHGIVHGSLHKRNIIVDRSGNVAVTHVSPYLYDDPSGDHGALSRLVAELRIPVDAPTATQLREIEEAKPIRSRARWLAIVFLIVGIGLAGTVWWLVRDV